MLSFYLSMIDSEEDRHKFEIIYDKYHLLIYHVAHQLTNDPEMVEDIAQETFLKIIKQIDTLRYENDKQFATLIGIMTRHCGYTYMSKDKRESFASHEIPVELERDKVNCEKVVMDKIVAERVMEEIENMDPMYSVPLRLSINGYKSDEVAKLLDISPENVRIRVYRAKKMISKKLGGKYGK